VIQVLVKQNMNSQSRLDSQIAEINGYMERFLTKQSHIADTAGKLHGCVTTEAEKFAYLSLPYLMFSQIDK